MQRLLFLIPLIMSTLACSQAEDYREDVGVRAEPSSAPSAEPVSAEPVTLKEETEEFSFKYSWPAQAAAYPELAKELQARADRNLKKLQAEAEGDFAEAANAEWEARPHSASIEWQVVADLPDWLSLSGNLATYSGGAHGLYGKTSLIWHKEEEREMKGIDLFVSAPALERALGARLCDALNAERERRRGEAVDPASDDIFDQCPGLDEATVLVGSSNGETFDRIGIYFGPYVAGAYAEGDFELDFPVTGAVLDAVKPEYAQSFSVRR